AHSSTVSFTAASDPSRAYPTRRSSDLYDFNNDGSFEISASSSASAAVPAAYVPNLGTRTMRGRITDQNGGFSDYTTTLTVNNVAATESIRQSGRLNQSAYAAVSFTSDS